MISIIILIIIIRRLITRAMSEYIIIIIIIITDLYSAFRSEDTEALDAAHGLSEFE